MRKKLNTTQKKNKQRKKTKLPWFSRLLQHSARKRGGLVSRTHMGHSLTETIEIFHLSSNFVIMEVFNERYFHSRKMMAKRMINSLAVDTPANFFLNYRQINVIFG